MHILHSTPFYCAKQYGTENTILLESSSVPSKAVLRGNTAQSFLTALSGHENSHSGDLLIQSQIAEHQTNVT